MLENPFNRAGLASLDDLSTPVWRSLFSHLESIQNEFTVAQPHCPEYPWPRDPLHNWIRVWEYPFVYRHLQSNPGSAMPHSKAQIVDLGSGATFFPFAIARLGYSVIAVDADPRAKASLDKAIGRVSAGAGSVTSLLADARSIDLETESVDGVYCISVLEHIPDFEAAIAEVRRILRPGGVFVLTFDIDLRGNWELGPASYRRLLDAIHTSFSMIHPEKVIHPLRVLNSDNSIYPMYPDHSLRDALVAPLRRSYHYARMWLRGDPLPRMGRLLVGTYGACLRKQ